MRQTIKNILIHVLTWEAKLVLVRYQPKIIAITGSVGKTSTKDAIFAALTGLTHVRKSEKSFNSELGVPLSILGLPNAWGSPFKWIENVFLGFWLIVFPHNYPKWLVLEVGTDRPGDIASITKWLKPDVTVLTRLPLIPVHVEFFESVEHVVQEKLNLVRALKTDGILIGNADDDRIALTLREYNGPSRGYGFSERAQIRATDISQSEKGSAITLHAGDEKMTATFPHLVAETQVAAALAAIAVADALGFNRKEVLANLSNFRTPPGRLTLIEGKNGSIILDDSYNSSPEAVQSALKLVHDMNVSGRKIAVLGDMLELGKFTEEAHAEVGKQAAHVVKHLVTVGVRAKGIAESAFMHGMKADNVAQFTDSREAGKALANIIGEGDLILVKGSQGIRLEKTVEELMAHPEEKEKLLVRQEEEWKRK
jgi:UDP-N-acetylmuramoyl-tripeptide--D-alanyl-D-alanine ligase